MGELLARGQLLFLIRPPPRWPIPPTPRGKQVPNSPAHRRACRTDNDSSRKCRPSPIDGDRRFGERTPQELVAPRNLSCQTSTETDGTDANREEHRPGLPVPRPVSHQVGPVGGMIGKPGTPVSKLRMPVKNGTRSYVTVPRATARINSLVHTTREAQRSRMRLRIPCRLQGGGSIPSARCDS